jgi:hypothetical protein
MATFEKCLQVLVDLVKSGGHGESFAVTPEGFFESREVRRATFEALPEAAQDLVLSVGLSMAFGVHSDGRSDKLCEEAKARVARSSISGIGTNGKPPEGMNIAGGGGGAGDGGQVGEHITWGHNR